MEKHILKNGLHVYIEPIQAKSVCVELCIKAGSVNEKKDISGISHFIEHMLFNGTKKRPSSHAISNEIEKLGGDFNAATSHERTFYYAKVPGKHIDVALDIISDMLINPLFDEKTIEKEKKIIIDEIKMVNDQPRFFQWVLFQQALFKKHPVRNPIYGSIEVVNKISKNNILDYYKKNYTPSNTHLFIVGNIGKDILKKTEKYFGSMKYSPAPIRAKVTEPKDRSSQIKRLKKKTIQSYMVMGYKTPNRENADSYVLDVIRAIIGRGQSGRMFDRIRTELGLAYEVGVLHHPGSDYGMFAVYVSTAKKNQITVRNEILSELKKLQNITENDLNEAKTFIEGEFILMSEETQKRADILAYWESSGIENGADNYLKKINSVTVADVKKASRKWLNDNYTIAIIE